MARFICFRGQLEEKARGAKKSEKYYRNLTCFDRITEYFLRRIKLTKGIFENDQSSKYGSSPISRLLGITRPPVARNF